MTITAVWSTPNALVAAGGLEATTGLTITQTHLNRLAERLMYLGGPDGNTHTGVWRPAADNTTELGTITSRWSTLYATGVFNSSTLYLRSGVGGSGSLLVDTSTGAMFGPETDNKVALGGPSNRWTIVYSATQSINTSRREAKEAFETVDPAYALAVVRRTPIVSYRYKVLPDRRFTGFVADDADPLLSPDGQTVDSTSPAAVCIAAIQALAARVEALEAAR